MEQREIQLPVALQSQLEVACRAAEIALLDRLSYEGIVGLNAHEEAQLVATKEDRDAQETLRCLVNDVAWWVNCADVRSHYEMLYCVWRETPTHVCAICHLFVY